MAVTINKVSEEFVDTHIIIRVTFLLGLITQRWCTTSTVLLLSLLLIPIGKYILGVFFLFIQFLLSYSSFHDTVKSFGLILLAEEISNQSNKDSVAWILGVTVMKIYNEKEQTEKDKLQKSKF